MQARKAEYKENTGVHAIDINAKPSAEIKQRVKIWSQARYYGLCWALLGSCDLFRVWASWVRCRAIAGVIYR